MFGGLPEPRYPLQDRDVKFRVQIGSDWRQMGQIWDFLRASEHFVTNLGLFKISFSTFWRGAPKCTDTDLKKSQICPISAPFGTI